MSSCRLGGGTVPNQRAIDEGGNKALEEERGLAYVGITRARRRLTVSFAANRRVYNQWSSSVPSRFVEELPNEHIVHLHRNPLLAPTSAPSSTTSRSPRALPADSARAGRRWAN